MVLILLGHRSRDHGDRNSTFFWDKLAQAFAFLVDLVNKLLEKNCLYDNYNSYSAAIETETLFRGKLKRRRWTATMFISTLHAGKKFKQ